MVLVSAAACQKQPEAPEPVLGDQVGREHVGEAAEPSGLGERPQGMEGRGDRAPVGPEMGSPSPGNQPPMRGDATGEPAGHEGREEPFGPGAQPNAAMPSEHAVCKSLDGEARLRVEDAQNGVVIVATPKTAAAVSTLKEDAKNIESLARAPAPPGPMGQTGDTCQLFTLAREPGVTTQVNETGNIVRITMTTSDPGGVKRLRQKGREAVAGLSRR